MIPLTFADKGEEIIIKKAGGSPEIKKHLEDMGFTAGSTIKIVAENGGNLIVSVKDVRVALSKELAQKIMF